MNAVEALDELQRKARHDDKLREQFIKDKGMQKILLEDSALYAVRRGMSFIQWMLYRPEMNFMPQ